MLRDIKILEFLDETWYTYLRRSFLSVRRYADAKRELRNTFFNYVRLIALKIQTLGPSRGF